MKLFNNFFTSAASRYLQLRCEYKIYIDHEKFYTQQSADYIYCIAEPVPLLDVRRVRR